MDLICRICGICPGSPCSRCGAGNSFGITFHQSSILMLFIHLEYIVGWCFQDLGILGQDHCLQDIDDLGDICHGDTVTVLVKNIQRGGSDNGIPHGVLLI